MAGKQGPERDERDGHRTAARMGGKAAPKPKAAVDCCAVGSLVAIFLNCRGNQWP